MSRNVTICTPFRDAAAHLDSYLARLSALELAGDRLRFVWVEGDSVDNTYAQLAMRRDADDRITLLKCDCGTPRYGSVVNPERFRTLARVFNTALDAVDLEWTDSVLFLPCDIEFDSDLLQLLSLCNLDIIAPFSYQDGRFYDIWAFRADGRNLGPFSELQSFYHFGARPVLLDSVGGTVLINVAVLRAGCRYTSDEVDVGLCKAARAAGFSVYGHPGVQVYHPSANTGGVQWAISPLSVAR